MNIKKLSELECLKIMDEFLNIQDDPKVGIFWYDPKEKELFGVRSVIASSINTNSISDLHEKVWSREYNKRKGKGLPLGVWDGDYKNTPRGRIFKSGDGFVVKTGKWIDDCPEVKELIIEEFDLKDSEVQFQYGIHWVE